MRAGTCHICGTLTIETRGAGFYGAGPELQGFLTRTRVSPGFSRFFAPTPRPRSVCRRTPIPMCFPISGPRCKRLAPEGGAYRHRSEGPDDMPAHIKTMLTAAQLSLPVRGGRLALGTWQEVYLIEHRTAPHRRRLELDFIGSAGGKR